MEQRALDCGADKNEWFCSFNNMSKESWLSVELWDGRQWKSQNVLGIKKVDVIPNESDPQISVAGNKKSLPRKLLEVIGW